MKQQEVYTETDITIGRYEVKEILGKGSMGTVYRALDPQLDRDVAVKLMKLPESLPEDERRIVIESFLREGRLAAKTSDRGIIQVYDVGVYNEQPFIVLELLDGTTLSRMLRKNASGLSFDRAIPIIREILQALANAHKRGVVHLDLKPSNIMVRKDGMTSIMDFGISKSVSEIELPAENIIGSPHYMSPEQIMGLSLDLRSDVFSLGILFYQLLSGVKPFPSDEFEELQIQISSRQHSSLRSFRTDLPRGLSPWVDKALCKIPDDRFANAGEMLKSFESILRRVKNRNEYMEGAIVCWQERQIGIYKKIDLTSGSDIIFEIHSDGKLTEKTIDLSDQKTRFIGHLAKSVCRKMQSEMTWDRGILTDHLFDTEDAGLVPVIYALHRKSKLSSQTKTTAQIDRETTEKQLRLSDDLKRQLVKGVRFSIDMSGRVWNAVYWAQDLKGSIIAHQSKGSWTLMHIDLNRFATSLRVRTMMPARDLLDLERALQATGTKF